MTQLYTTEKKSVWKWLQLCLNSVIIPFVVFVLCEFIVCQQMRGRSRGSLVACGPSYSCGVESKM